MVQAVIPTTVTGIQGVAVSTVAPTVNQALTWNGSAWAPAGPFLPINGGTLTGPVTIAGGSSAANVFNVQGVIDGSAAAVGSQLVGEIVGANGGPFTIANGTWASPAAITFQPGDWDIWGLMNFTPPVGDVVQYLSNVSQNPNTFGPLTSVISGNGQGTCAIIAPTTIWRLTANTTIYLNGYCFTNSGANCQMSGTITGRRRR